MSVGLIPSKTSAVNFLPTKGIYIIKKEMIDIACKDINDNIYDSFFEIQISLDNQKSNIK